MRREDLEEGKIGLEPELAGEPDRGVGTRAHAVEHEGFAVGGRGKRAMVADHANPAGRAAGAAATHAGMRDLMAKARLEYGKTLRHPYGAAIAVGQADHAAAALDERTRPSCREDERDQAEIADQEIIRDAFQGLLLGRRAHDGLRQIGGPPFGAGALPDNGTSRLIEAESRQR